MEGWLGVKLFQEFRGAPSKSEGFCTIFRFVRLLHASGDKRNLNAYRFRLHEERRNRLASVRKTEQLYVEQLYVPTFAFFLFFDWVSIDCVRRRGANSNPAREVSAFSDQKCIVQSTTTHSSKPCGYPLCFRGHEHAARHHMNRAVAVSKEGVAGELTAGESKQQRACDLPPDFGSFSRRNFFVLQHSELGL